jgi:hypothetical protein
MPVAVSRPNAHSHRGPIAAAPETRANTPTFRAWFWRDGFAGLERDSFIDSTHLLDECR